MTIRIGRFRIELPCVFCRSGVGKFSFWAYHIRSGRLYGIHVGWLYFELT